MKGRIFQRGNYFWIAYYHHGKQQRECALHVRTHEKITALAEGTKEREKAQREAERFLRQRLDEITTEKYGGPGLHRLQGKAHHH